MQARGGRPSIAPRDCASLARKQPASCVPACLRAVGRHAARAVHSCWLPARLQDGWSVCVVYCLDAHFITDVTKFIAGAMQARSRGARCLAGIGSVP